MRGGPSLQIKIGSKCWTLHFGEKLSRAERRRDGAALLGQTAPGIAWQRQDSRVSESDLVRDWSLLQQAMGAMTTGRRATSRHQTESAATQPGTLCGNYPKFVSLRLGPVAFDASPDELTAVVVAVVAVEAALLGIGLRHGAVRLLLLHLQLCCCISCNN